MPKANISLVHAAEKLYKKGKSYDEIKAKLGISHSTISKWKRLYGWSRPDASPGAPKGSKNAVGAGPPIGNQNAVTHGGYSRLLLDSLTEKEKEYYEGSEASDDEETMILYDIRLLDIRISRLMRQIKDMQRPGGLYIDSVSTYEEKRRFESDEEKEVYDAIIQSKIDSGARLPGTPYKVSTTTKNAEEFILSCQEALNRAQAQKQRCIDSLIKLREIRRAENPNTDIEDLQELRKAIFGDNAK